MLKLKPIKLAVIFDQEIEVGGGYQQALNAALVAKRISNNVAEVFFFTTIKKNINLLLTYGINSSFINISLFEKVINYFRIKIINFRLLKIIKFFFRYSAFEKYLINKNIDLVYFLSPSNLPQSLEELNYIITVWDLSHREDPEFPEVRFNRQFENRESNYKAILPRAVAILVDSDIGKANLSHYYNIDIDRIKVMPFQASEFSRRKTDLKNKMSIDIKKKYQLNVPYVFYPAQLWAHKNHIYLLRGLFILALKYNLRIGAIFSGGDKNNQKYIETNVKKLNLESYVRFTGFVSDDEIFQLYKQSLALVMPSYFGPTNLPPLEAFSIGIPVLYSDIKGLKDQVGDAALLMDLTKPDSLSLHLKTLLEDTDLRNRLIAKGNSSLKHFDSYDRVKILKDIIENYQQKRICWDK